MRDADLRAFNKNWLSQYFNERIPAGVIVDLPTVTAHSAKIPECIALAEQMACTFVAPILSVAEFTRLRDAETQRPESSSGPSGDVVIAQLVKQWLELARVESLKVPHGGFEGLFHLHLTFELADFLGDLNNSQISQMAAVAAVERMSLFRWAWPQNVFAAAQVIHRNVFPQWAFGLAA